MKKKVFAAAAAGVMAVTLVSCSGGGTTPAETEDPGAVVGEPQAGGTVVFGSLSEMPGFDPVRLVALGTGVERAAQVMDTLMYRDDKDDQVKPKLAKDLSSDDGKVWVMQLREGVTFTDGEPLNAEAVIFNLERHVAPDSTSSARSMLSGLDTMEATGEYEVTFTLKEPSGSFPLTFTASSPASLIGSPKALADPDKFNESPVGAGPFVFESWMRDSELKLMRNDDYYVEGQPYLDALVYKVLPETQARIDSVLSGGVTIAQIAGSSWASMEGNDAFTVLPASVGGQLLVPNSTRGPGADERVREAIGLAVDPQITKTIVFPGSDLWDGNRDCLPFADGAAACVAGASPKPDLEKAKSLVAEYVADGGDVKVDYIAPATTDEIVFYQSQMTAIGLEVNLRVTDAGGWLADTMAGNYDVAFGVIGSAGYPTQWRYMDPNGFNYGQGDYPELSDALMRARDELKLEDRNQAWKDVSNFVKENNVLFWQAPFSNAMTFSNKLHIGSEEFPYRATLMVYFDSAWLEQ